jgi:uncharacterized delta-60 repeat protein
VEAVEDRVLLSPGDLDPTFGSGGKVTTDLGSPSDQARRLAIQSDGKIVVVGSDGGAHFALVRYNADGSLDTKFGTGGKVLTDFGGGMDNATGVVLQPNGEILVGGDAVTNGTWNFALARYNPNGTLDTTFGSSGMVTTDFAGAADFANGLALQADGKILLAGSAQVGSYSDFALARYNPDGTLDSTFGSGGLVTTYFGSPAGGIDAAEAVLVQADGKVIAVGRTFIASSNSWVFALARYTTAGALDTTFGSGGLVKTTGSNAAQPFDAALQADGKIVAAGWGYGTFEDFALVRYNSDGTLDTGFGAGGTVLTDMKGQDDLAHGVAIQANGKIVAVGTVNDGLNMEFGVVRYNADGTLDPTFGAGGKVFTSFTNTDEAYGVGLQQDGKIVVAGYAGSQSQNSNFAVARYLGDAVAHHVSWINASGGDWDTASNWSTGRVPGASDDVTIDVSSAIIVTHSKNVADSVHSLTVGNTNDSLTLSGGSLSVASSSTISGPFHLTGGTLSGAGAVTIGGAMTWADNGTLAVTGGAVAKGNLTIAADGSAVSLGGGSLTTDAKATLNGTIHLKGGAVWANAAGATLTWTGGTLDASGGTFTNGGTMTLSGVGIVTLSGTLTNNGKLSQTAAGTLKLSGGATLANSTKGTVNITADAAISGGTIANSGTLEKTAGTGTTAISSALNNTGKVYVDSGEVTISGAVAQVSGSTLKAGIWQIGMGSTAATLSITSAPALTTLGASANVTLDGPSTTFANLSGLTTDQGSFSLLGGKSFTTAGSFTNSGKLTLGPGSVLAVKGSFTETSTGKLTVQIGGTNASPTIGSISVTGTVTLGGSLSLADAAKVIPAVNKVLSVLNNLGGAGISGTFTNLPEGSTLKVTVGTTTMTFKISYKGGSKGRNVTLTRTS